MSQSPRQFPQAIALPVTLDEARERLRPLWRYGAWFAVLFVVCAASVLARLDVQELRQDIDRAQRQQRRARIVNERLHLESDVRRRAAAVEIAAAEHDLGPEARVVVVRLDP
jgi:hypothetical protein